MQGVTLRWYEVERLKVVLQEFGEGEGEASISDRLQRRTNHTAFLLNPTTEETLYIGIIRDRDHTKMSEQEWVSKMAKYINTTREKIRKAFIERETDVLFSTV